MMILSWTPPPSPPQVQFELHLQFRLQRGAKNRVGHACVHVRALLYWVVRCAHPFHGLPCLCHVSHESCHVRMSHVPCQSENHIKINHVTYEGRLDWVVRCPCLLHDLPCLCHVTYEWVMSRMNASCHMWMSHMGYEWVLSHINESWPSSAALPPHVF